MAEFNHPEHRRLHIENLIGLNFHLTIRVQETGKAGRSLRRNSYESFTVVVAYTTHLESFTQLEAEISRLEITC